MDITNIYNKPFVIVPKIDVPDLGRGVLPVQRFGQFVRAIRESSVIIKEARILNAMKSYEVDISRISLGVELEAGRDETGSKVAPTDDEVEVTTNTLSMKELTTAVTIEDEALEDNIEQQQFEQTIVSLLGEGISYDLEVYFLHADTTYTGDRALLKTNDGWLTLAGEKVTDTDPTNETWPTNLFDDMIEALENKYKQKLPQMKFYVSYQIWKAYKDQLKGRETGLGDQALTGGDGVPYDGVPVQYVPALDALNDGKVRALLTIPTNLVYGFWRNIRIEPARDARMRRTSYIATLRADCHYEDENAAVSAKIAAPTP
ncbi:MAG: phage major capsid protein [Thermoplasmatales archaeon]|nr:phage major capsid protein [Thermoplasmatales archaeon]